MSDLVGNPEDRFSRVEAQFFKECRVKLTDRFEPLRFAITHFLETAVFYGRGFSIQNGHLATFSFHYRVRELTIKLSSHFKLPLNKTTSCLLSQRVNISIIFF